MMVTASVAIGIVRESPKGRRHPDLRVIGCLKDGGPFHIKRKGIAAVRYGHALFIFHSKPSDLSHQPLLKLHFRLPVKFLGVVGLAQQFFYPVSR
jgi:hypothetical protein